MNVEHLNVGNIDMKEFIDKTTERSGTPINRKNMMAIQGFEALHTTFSEDGGKITSTNADGETLTTTFNADGSIVEVFEGEKTITKTTTFNPDGSIDEVIS